jgi:hypothetical protein
MADLNVKVGLDRSGFQTGLAAMENATLGFGRNLGGLLAGAFSFTAITQQVTAAISQAGRLQDLSDTFGISAESIQRIGNAAAESGGSIEDVGRALAKIGVGAQQAFAGNEQLAASFAAIGVRGQDLVSLSPEQLFYRLAAAMNDGSLAGKDLAVAKDLLGRGFSTLMPVLKMTEEQIRAVGEAAGIMSDDAVAKLDAFGDSWGRLSNKVKVKAAEIIDASIRLGEELMANPTGLFGDWQEIEKRIEARQRRDKEARDALQKVREAPGGDGPDPVAVEKKKQQEIDKTASLYERADKAARQNFLNSLNDADRLVELLKEEAALRQQITNMQEGPDRATATLEMLTLSGQIDRLRRTVQQDVISGMIPEESSAVTTAAEDNARRERLQEMNRLRGNAPDFDPREALINRFQGAGGGLTPAALQDTVKNTTVQGIDGKIATVIGKLDALINAAGRFS